MLQVKIWGFKLAKPNGFTPKKMEEEINPFLKSHNCVEDTFEMFEMEGYMMFKVIYKVRKKK